MDMEKVIKGLEFTKAMITFNPSTGEDIEPENLNEADKTSYDACVGAIALLKEQQQQIWEFQDQVEYLTDKLKEQEGLLGIQQTADSITFISTGTAQQGESRGLLLGKSAMHEWLKKELIYRGLLTDDIRAVFDEAKL